MLKVKWDLSATKKGLQPSFFGLKVIVDDILLYAKNNSHVTSLLAVRLSGAYALKFLDPEALEFVGIDVGQRGSSPAKSKYATFRQLGRPSTWSDLSMIIGMFGFYQKFLPHFEHRIQLYRKIQAKQPKPGELSMEEETARMAALWEPEH